MQESGIPVPHHICVNREGLPEGADPEGFIETEDFVEISGIPLRLRPLFHAPCCPEI